MASPLKAAKRRRTTCKTGCLTCRARKVKCDEGKPACHRCVSTGRICEGYGIWGGGSNGYARYSPHPCLQACVPASHYTPDEERYMGWFYLRTIPKIPGIFAQDFWITLLHQASVSEPAVFYATLTLSSIHKTIPGDNTVSRKNLISSEQEKFILRNYSKSIHHLQPHLTTKDERSIRITLITCAVFTCLEFLRGNFKTAQTHINNGLLILQEYYGNTHDGSILLRTTDATDRLITEIFQRLHLQIQLFHRTYHHPIVILQPSTPSVTPRNFGTFKEAWAGLERILYQIIALAGNAHQNQLHVTGPPTEGIRESGLILSQQQIQISLAQWYIIFKSSRPQLDQLNLRKPTSFVNAMLMNYYALATILSSALLSSEFAYDVHTASFLAILSNSIRLWTSRPGLKVDGALRFDMLHSVIDFGWAPPLYYTAIKCRVRRIRLHALRLLESTIHREGFWDCRIASRIMRKVMEIEDEGIYEDESEEFSLDTLPEIDELSLPTLPLERRLAEIRVEMNDEVTESVVMEYRKACHDARWEHVRIPLMDMSPNGR